MRISDWSSDVCSSDLRRGPSVMRAYRFDRLGAIDDLKLLDIPLSTPVAGEVTVRMRAASLNYRDLLITGNCYPGASPPIVPLSDAVGEIVACGPAVTPWRTGDRVRFSFFRDWIAGPRKARLDRTRVGEGQRGQV